jgi:transposase
MLRRLNLALMHKKDKLKFTAAFKVKVGMEGLKKQSTIAQIAQSYELHPSQMPDWKKTLSERSEELFTSKGKKTALRFR